MNESESIEHIEMFVRNKIREGYSGLFPKRSAKNNVLRSWNTYKNKGANLEAVTALGGSNQATDLIKSTTERILNSKEELQAIVKGDYSGSHEDLIGEIWKD